MLRYRLKRNFFRAYYLSTNVHICIYFNNANLSEILPCKNDYFLNLSVVVHARILEIYLYIIIFRESLGKRVVTSRKVSIFKVFCSMWDMEKVSNYIAYITSKMLSSSLNALLMLSSTGPAGNTGGVTRQRRTLKVLLFWRWTMDIGQESRKKI